MVDVVLSLSSLISLSKFCFNNSEKFTVDVAQPNLEYLQKKSKGIELVVVAVIDSYCIISEMLTAIDVSGNEETR